MEYIELTIHTLTMTFSLPRKKATDLRNSCRSTSLKGSILLRDILSILGNLNWASFAVDLVQSQYRGFQALCISSFKPANSYFHERIKLNAEWKADLACWSPKADFQTGRVIQTESPTISNSSNATLSGWKGVCGEVKTSGPWTTDKTLCHINELDLLATLKALLSETLTQKHTVEVKIDKTRTVSYINKLGVNRSSALCAVALRITEWCELRKLDLNAVFSSYYECLSWCGIAKALVIGGPDASAFSIKKDSENMADEGGFVHECVEHPDPEICEEQRSSHLHRVTVERWPENPSICPLTTLKKYLNSRHHYAMMTTGTICL